MNTNMLNVDLDKNNIVEPPKQGEKKLCNANQLYHTVLPRKTDEFLYLSLAFWWGLFHKWVKHIRSWSSNLLYCKNFNFNHFPDLALVANWTVSLIKTRSVSELIQRFDVYKCGEEEIQKLKVLCLHGKASRACQKKLIYILKIVKTGQDCGNLLIISFKLKNLSPN